MADHIRFRSARHKNKLKFFRQSDHGEGRAFHRNKSFQCRGKLTFSTVHHKEIRQGEVIFQQPFEMTGHCLFHHGKVIGSGHSLDPETAVVRFVRCAIGKMYQTCHCEGPGDIGDIETLNRPWRQIQFQCGLQIFHSSHSRCGIGDRGIFKSAVFLTVHRFDVGGNIPVQCGFFKLLFFRTFFHFQFQNFPHIFDIAVQYGDQLVHTRPVLFLRHLVFAGTAAIFQCSSQTMFAVVRSGIGSFTGAQTQMLNEEFRSHFQCPAFWKRSEIKTGIIFFQPCHFQPGEFFREIQFQHQVAFVIPHEDVVMGGIFFDKMGFQQQSFIFIFDSDIFPGINGIDERTGFGIGTGDAARLEILRHPPPQIGCFPHIDHHTEDVTVNVTSRFCGDIARIKVVFLQIAHLKKVLLIF